MTGLLRSILSIIVCAAVVSFAIGNRQESLLTWSPMHEPATIPVFLIGLCGLLIGFFIGGSMVWLNGSVDRKIRRDQMKTIRNLEAELDKDEKEKNNNMHAPLIIEQKQTGI